MGPDKLRLQEINESSVFTCLLYPSATAASLKSRDTSSSYVRSSTASKSFATPSCLERDMTPPTAAAASLGAPLLQDMFPGLPLQSSGNDMCAVACCAGMDQPPDHFTKGTS